jgi:DNA-binding NarL/FixJ family response regulator
MSDTHVARVVDLRDARNARILKTPDRTTEAAVIDVVVVEDNPGTREALVALLNSDPDISVVGVGVDGDEVLDVVERTHPQVALLDVMMPRVDGLEATRRLLAVRPESRVLLLSAMLSTALVREALAAGAAGYQLKGDDPADLLAAIRAVARGESAWCPMAAAYLSAS